MTETPTEETTLKIQTALDKLREELPAMANILDAFGDLVVCKALIKADLMQSWTAAPAAVDPERFRQGAPIIPLGTLRIPDEHLRKAAVRIMPAISKGFPKLEAQVDSIRKAIEDGALDLEQAAADSLAGVGEPLQAVSGRLEVAAEILGFVLSQLARPFLEMAAEQSAHLLEGLEWLRGYCSVCGSWPSLTLIKGQEGQRWLRCSLCAHQWRFSRTQCPFCETDQADALHYLYSQDRDFEFAETCKQCKRYIVGIDLRKRIDEPLPDVASLGMVYLDILAQQEGYNPGAVTDWNMVR